MEKLERRLAFVQDDIQQIYPSCSSYPLQKAMVECLSTILELRYTLQLFKKDK